MQVKCLDMFSHRGERRLQMYSFVALFLKGVAIFFVLYLLIYTTYLFSSVLAGAFQLFDRDRRRQIRNELTHEYYMPISILVPAYNEEVTIVDNIKSLLELDYKLYEIIVVDDGSKDNTSKVVAEAFEMMEINRPIHRQIKCKPIKKVYEKKINNITLTLITKENGGKGDALNAGINASKYPYFLCIDADSFLQKDSLELLAQPLLEDENIVAIGGMVHVAQCMGDMEAERLTYHLPKNPVVAMQAVEYDRSFLASRILMDGFNGNLIISGAFGLFRKDVVIAAGGYATDTLGEDMELVVKLHVFCRNNSRPYAIRYEPNACCWSQVPGSLKDLMKQRRRWHLGLFQCMVRYAGIFGNPRFGLVSAFSYMYYLLYELMSPLVEVFGLFSMIVAYIFRFLNFKFMIQFFLLYGIYGAVLTMTAFMQRIYTRNLKISAWDVIRTIYICLLESIFFRYVLSYVRVTAFFNYKKKKDVWGSLKREKFKQ